MNFNYVPLSELCVIHYGKDHKKLSNGRYPVYGSGGIIRYVDHFLCDKPSVLIPRKGTLSNLFYVDKPFWTVDTIFWTEINEEKVNPKFLYYFLLTKNLEELNIGSAVPSLSTEVLNKIVISLPPVSIQNKIVSILSTFDSKIESNNKINDNLSKHRMSHFNETAPDSNFGNSTLRSSARAKFSKKHLRIFEKMAFSWLPRISKELAEKHGIWNVPTVSADTRCRPLLPFMFLTVKSMNSG